MAITGGITFGAKWAMTNSRSMPVRRSRIGEDAHRKFAGILSRDRRAGAESSEKVDRLALKTPAVDSPKAQMFGCTAACFTERVEDNAFHLRAERVSAPPYIPIEICFGIFELRFR